MEIKGSIFIPMTRLAQKIKQLTLFGGEWIAIKLVGDSFDDASEAGQAYTQETGGTFIYVFNDKLVI
ncbi:MAG: threonine dehydratase [Algoriphagus sp.]|jgi:threonine dehydratase